MKKRDLFGDEESEVKGEDFETMLNQSMNVTRRKVGESFKGEILSIGKEQAFISTGTPTDGQIPTLELLSPDKVLQFKTGDVIEVRVLRVREGEMLLRREDAKGAAAGFENLEDAFDMELPVEGKVLEVVKGGYRVQIGNAKAFCPISQMDLRAGADSATHVGQKYEFLVTQFEEKGRNIVVSRRRYLEQQRTESEGQFLQTAKPGDLFTGTIMRIEKFGAFVSIDNGLEGLIPISEMAWGRVQNPGDVVTIGQKVPVALIKAEEQGDRLRLSFSMKQAGGESDPWLKVMNQCPVGTIIEGTVDKKENFGLFVQLAPGISGLLPRSKWRDSSEASQYESKKKGDKIQVMVHQVQFEEKRLTLGLPSEKEDSEWRDHAGAASGPATKGLGPLRVLFKK
ncbi:MAG: S1 RNA-binding domain-containing protein [Bdellovibrio sp.]